MTNSLRKLACSALVALAAASCDQPPEEGTNTPSSASASAPAQPEMVNVYWTGTGEDGTPAFKSTLVTRAEVDKVLALRAANRGKLAPANVVGSVASTIVSTDWTNACQWWNWALFTSQPGGGGDLACAAFSGDFADRTSAVLPFVPQYFESSSSHFMMLCEGWVTTCKVWATQGAPQYQNVWKFVPQGTTVGNISPPAGINRVRVGGIQEAS